ncbi:pentapeptide repeat-containing protein [Nostoc cf. edaphicum LEGE 07299]|uniref:Pentapeptide repeat-containing protein n=1 Tax=Nostoc cf. edaphicum LEGE 07299 TaxID=2777974 RepID=A0ABR9U1U9_9NOSO|nr:pentapeptide repeat-containing protein [Nostoc edaphicum]MBE9106630.1 pentapeptide repeat-containing protein [Nostoc cf. edaphicum LEGE 07299]
MNKRLSQTWQKFQQSFSIEESLNTTVETGKAVLEAAEHLKAWTQYEETEDGKQLVILEDQMNWQIYDLLGFGRLTPEIVESLMRLLTKKQDFSWEQLFKRLENFYHNWCKGKFIDSAKETLPQKKLQQLQQYGIQGLGQREVDIYAGLNVMILLLELHRYATGRDDLRQEIVFYPSGQTGADNFEEYQLTRVINYSDCFQLGTFSSVVGQFFSNANLSGAYFRGADLSEANLSYANLSGAYFGLANLNRANLKGANLCGAYFGGASLDGANLSDASLSAASFYGANLSGANLSGATLSGATLIGANLYFAVLGEANLSKANFRGAELGEANLSGANLSRANLSGADLSYVNLSSADLSGANLKRANLKGANLCGADLWGANLSRANLSQKSSGDMDWDENTNWENVEGLDTAVNVPKALKKQLRLS